MFQIYRDGKPTCCRTSDRRYADKCARSQKTLHPKSVITIKLS
jgi:hypothetical protein